MKYVLIDDDKLIHLGWSSKASKSGIELLHYDSIEDFIANSAEIPKDAQIYIDSNLKKNYKGEEEAKKIFNLGFENLFLSTGFTDLELIDYPWFKGIVSKRPPF